MNSAGDSPQQTDARLLLAVLHALLYTGEASSRDTVASAAGFIGPDVPPEAELTAGLARLARAGLVEDRDGVYMPTGAVLDAYQPAHTPGDPKPEEIRAELEWAERFIACW
jgi:hypothetical protein